MASTHSSIVPGSLLTAQLIPDHELRRAFEVNVIGPMSLTRRLLPSLRAAQGRIVNIGAISAQTTPPFFGAAGATKSALASFNDALRMECAKFGVEVVLIEPGALKTDIFATAAKTQVAVLDRASKQVVAIYKAEMDAMHAALAKREADTPDVVVAATLRALNDKKPKPRVVVGKGASRLAKLRLLPDRMRDRMLLNAFGVAKLRGYRTSRRPAFSR